MLLFGKLIKPISLILDCHWKVAEPDRFPVKEALLPNATLVSEGIKASLGILTVTAKRSVLSTVLTVCVA